MEILTFVESTYVVHENMQSHTGGLVSFGIGAAHYVSTTSKMNVNISTESELLSSSEYLPCNLWMRNFIISQG